MFLTLGIDELNFNVHLIARRPSGFRFDWGLMNGRAASLQLSAHIAL